MKYLIKGALQICIGTASILYGATSQTTMSFVLFLIAWVVLWLLYDNVNKNII